MMNELEYELLLAIGLSVDSNCNLIDQDYGTIVYLNGKNIKAKRGAIEPFIRRTDVYFDPVNNVKLMRTLFQYFINKINDLDNRYFSVFFPVFKDNGSTAIEIKSETESFRSDYYYNESLRYIDLIFKISGYEYVDMKKYDFKVR